MFCVSVQFTNYMKKWVNLLPALSQRDKLINMNCHMAVTYVTFHEFHEKQNFNLVFKTLTPASSQIRAVVFTGRVLPHGTSCNDCSLWMVSAVGSMLWRLRGAGQGVGTPPIQLHMPSAEAGKPGPGKRGTQLNKTQPLSPRPQKNAAGGFVVTAGLC